MLEVSDIEAIAKEVFRELKLNWIVSQQVESDTRNQRWWIRARMPDHSDVYSDFYPNKGSRDDVKESLTQMVERRLQQLDSR